MHAAYFLKAAMQNAVMPSVCTHTYKHQIYATS